MDPTSIIKALLLNAAYEGACAVCEPLASNDGKPLPIDPLIGDVGLQNKGVLVYEEAKVQYNALVRAFQDKTGVWPDPTVPTGTTTASTLPALATQLTGLLSKLPRDSAIANIGQLLDALTKTATMLQ